VVGEAPDSSAEAAVVPRAASVAAMTESLIRSFMDFLSVAIGLFGRIVNPKIDELQS
jgi:hypothetical protein